MKSIDYTWHEPPGVPDWVMSSPQKETPFEQMENGIKQDGFKEGFKVGYDKAMDIITPLQSKLKILKREFPHIYSMIDGGDFEQS